MPLFLMEGQPGCAFVAKTGIGWAALSLTPYLWVWQDGQANSLEYQMSAYSGSLAPQLTWAQVASATAFAAGDGNYQVMWVMKNAGGVVQVRAKSKLDVVVRDSLPSPA
jgi:hypothetical protein